MKKSMHMFCRRLNVQSYCFQGLLSMSSNCEQEQECISSLAQRSQTFIHACCLTNIHLGLAARKPVFGGLRTSQAQTSLRIFSIYYLAPFGKKTVFATYVTPYGKRIAMLKSHAYLCTYAFATKPTVIPLCHLCPPILRPFFFFFFFFFLIFDLYAWTSERLVCNEHAC